MRRARSMHWLPTDWRCRSDFGWKYPYLLDHFDSSSKIHTSCIASRDRLQPRVWICWTAVDMVNTKAQITAWKKCRKSDLTVNGTSEHLNHVIRFFGFCMLWEDQTWKHLCQLDSCVEEGRRKKGDFLLSLPLALYGLDKI